MPFSSCIWMILKRKEIYLLTLKIAPLRFSWVRTHLFITGLITIKHPFAETIASVSKQNLLSGRRTMLTGRGKRNHASTPISFSMPRGASQPLSTTGFFPANVVNLSRSTLRPCMNPIARACCPSVDSKHQRVNLKYLN